jgi:DNA-binding beta-propeller fold protein YncE
LAFDNSGNLYVALYSYNAIVKVTPGGSQSFFATSGLSGPSGLAVDSHGNLFVANVNNGTIEEYNTNGVGTVFASGLNFPQALAFDTSGKLYAADHGNNAIDEFDKNGNESIFASGIGGLSGLAFDSSGNLYASMVGGANMILEFNPSGHATIFATGLSNPAFLAIQVPEPATWALVALGAGALLRSHRLRHHSS